MNLRQFVEKKNSLNSTDQKSEQVGFKLNESVKMKTIDSNQSGFGEGPSNQHVPILSQPTQQYSALFKSFPYLNANMGSTANEGMNPSQLNASFLQSVKDNQVQKNDSKNTDFFMNHQPLITNNPSFLMNSGIMGSPYLPLEESKNNSMASRISLGQQIKPSEKQADSINFAEFLGKRNIFTSQKDSNNESFLSEMNVNDPNNSFIR